MSNLYSHVRAAVAGVPWLVYPPTMDVIADVLSRRLAGERFTEAEIAARIAGVGREAGRRGPAGQARGDIAVIPIYGVLAHRSAMIDNTSSAGTSVESLQQSFRQALADPNVASILFDVDSPGGSVSGIPEFASEVMAARGRKPMAAVSNTLMASAALWLGLMADEVIVSSSSLTGSVGVVMAHQDETGMEEKMGIKTTLVYSGDYKVEGYPTVPLTDDALAYMKGLCEDIYGSFTSSLAKARGLSVQQVRDNFGKGRVLMPKDAVKAGMADRVGTFDDAVARLAAGRVEMRTAQAGSAEFVAGQTYRIVSIGDPVVAVVDQQPDEPSNDRSQEAAAAVALARAKSA